MTPEEARTLLERLQQAGNIDDPVYAESSDAIIPMLETIAAMRWEYAVRIDFETGSRLHVRPGFTTRYADCALWRAKLEEARKIADQARTQYPQPVHIVRRLVSDPEVNRNHELMAAAPTLARAIAGEPTGALITIKETP